MKNSAHLSSLLICIDSFWPQGASLLDLECVDAMKGSIVRSDSHHTWSLLKDTNGNCQMLIGWGYVLQPVRKPSQYSAVNNASKKNPCIFWENILMKITHSWGYKPEWLFSGLNLPLLKIACCYFQYKALTHLLKEHWSNKSEGCSINCHTQIADKLRCRDACEEGAKQKKKKTSTVLLITLDHSFF